MLNVQKIKADFPILARKVNGKALVYLDNAATSQKPASVLEAVDRYYETSNANVHRGSYTLADEATFLYEKARETLKTFVGASSNEEIIFVKNTTEAINLVAYSYASKNLKEGDEILLGVWEHHSNLVLWQEIGEKTGAKLVYMHPTKEGLFDFKDFTSKLTKNTKLVTVAQASNVLGTIFPVSDIVAEAKKFGALVSVDGAQSVPHMPIDVKKLGCDFLAFSGHKMLGPMGIGVLYVKSDIYPMMEPFIAGGGMIAEVSKQKSTWEEPPYKFEAGTPNVGGAVGLTEAVNYLQKVGMSNIREHEVELTAYALGLLERIEKDIPQLEVLGPKDPKKRSGLVSFYHPKMHAHDVAAILDKCGVAVRSGFHCAMPLHQHFNVGPTFRASWYIYNDKSDIDALFEGIVEASRVLL